MQLLGSFYLLSHATIESIEALQLKSGDFYVWVIC